MKKFQVALMVTSLIAIAGCDDSNDSGTVCNKQCGNGTCFISGTQEKCSCDEGAKEDAEGVCSLCKTGYKKYNGVCEPESICTDQCTADHMTCSVKNKKPVCGCEDYYDLKNDKCVPWEECNTKISFSIPDAKNTSVYLVGDFNKWPTGEIDKNSASVEQYKMTENPAGSGNFEISVYIDPGTYNYKFYIPSWNDKYVGQGASTSGGNLSISIASCEDNLKPFFKLDDEPTVSNGKATFKFEVVDTRGFAGDIDVEVTKSTGGNVDVTRDGDYWVVTDDMGTDKKVSYTVTGKSSNDKVPDKLFVPVWNEDKVFDWHDAILYFAFTDRFLNGNNANDAPLNVNFGWAGGDFAGLKAKVEEGYFDNLGVNALWISSVSMNTQSIVGADGYTMSAYHSYWPISTGYTDETASMFDGATSNGVPFSPIEPHFGTLEELKALVDACHARGIRVLVDFAANHVNSESPVFQKHPEWFNYYDKPQNEIDSILCAGPNNSQANWNIIPETCWFGDNLPDFNFNLPEVRKFVVDHAKWLIRTTNIDGFRLDAVKHMPQQLIRDLRSGIDSMMEGSGQTFYIVGETFDGADMIRKYIGDDMLHGQFEFPLYNTIRSSVLSKDGGNFQYLHDYTQYNDAAFGDAIMSTFLGNHDVARAISHVKGESEDKYANNNEVYDSWAYLRLKLAWTFLLTSPGIPLIYYGDEYGLEGANDPDNRRMMEFGDTLNDEQKGTLGFVQLLGKVRREHPALTRGKRKNIGYKDRSYMYLMQGEGETILVGISDTTDNQYYRVEEGGKGWINLLNESETITDTQDVNMYGGRQIIVWKLKD